MNKLSSLMGSRVRGAARVAAIAGLGLSLALGVAACSGLPGGSGSSATQQAGSSAYDQFKAAKAAKKLKAELPDMDASSLQAAFTSDTNFADQKDNLVAVTDLVIDKDARTVTIDVETSTTDTKLACKLGESVAQCLSDHATVTDAKGREVSDNGPCGALFEAYELSVNVEGPGSEDVWSGMLHAGAPKVEWQ